MPYDTAERTLFDPRDPQNGQVLGNYLLFAYPQSVKLEDFINFHAIEIR